MNFIRTNESITMSKVARYEPRCTGRTTNMVRSMPAPDEFDGKLYVVAHSTAFAKAIIQIVERIKGSEVSKRCVPVGASYAITALDGVDPFNVFIDHVALEYGELRDIKFLYSILDRQNIWG